MEKKILAINKNKLELIDSEVQPYGFLQQNQPYFNLIRNLLQSQEILNDPKIMKTLANLLSN